MATPELKPCAFCGGEASLIENRKERDWEISCLKCGAGLINNSKKTAIAAWNRAWMTRRPTKVRSGLKPCPTCGGKVLITVADNDERWVSCRSCRMAFSFDLERSVKNVDTWLARKWNRWASQIAARLRIAGDKEPHNINA